MVQKIEVAPVDKNSWQFSQFVAQAGSNTQ